MLALILLLPSTGQKEDGISVIEHFHGRVFFAGLFLFCGDLRRPHLTVLSSCFRTGERLNDVPIYQYLEMVHFTGHLLMGIIG